VKVVFATIGNTRDIQRGSGTPFYLWQYLLKAGVEVHLVGPINIKIPIPTRVFKWLSKKAGKKYHSFRDPFVGRRLGSAVRKSIEGIDFDVLLTNDFCIAGYVDINKPVILYTDYTYPMKSHDTLNERFSKLSRVSECFTRYTTKLGLLKASLCLFASQFASDNAVQYGVKSHYKVIPYGANIEFVSDELDRSMEKVIQKKRLDILFIGKDWEHKGGEIAIKVTQLLNSKGLTVHLHIVGVDFSDEIHDESIHFYGLLNKDSHKEKEQLEGLFRNCDLLLVPSRAEGYGLVFVEAAAYGMPSLAFASTGLNTSVKHEVTGVLLPRGKGAEDFAEAILDFYDIPGKYDKLVKGARAHYLKIANWQVATEELISLVEPLLLNELAKGIK